MGYSNPTLKTQARAAQNHAKAAPRGARSLPAMRRSHKKARSRGDAHHPRLGLAHARGSLAFLMLGWFRSRPARTPRVIDARRGYRSLKQVRDGLLTALLEIGPGELEKLGGCS